MKRVAAWSRSWRRQVAALGQNLAALYLAMRDPRVPRASRFVIVLVVAYALSPIDLIPDFIPVLGLLDDLLIVPAGLWLAVRLMPAAVWQDCQARALSNPPALPRNRVAAACIVVTWIALTVGLGYVAWRSLQA